MQARVATFENRDVSRDEELLGHIRSQSSAVPGVQRHLMLLDSKSRSALEITFFDSEDELRSAEPELHRIDREIPETMRGRRTSVSVYEVAVDEPADDALAARVSTLRSDSYRVRDMLQSVREQILGEGLELPGWRGVIALADLGTGYTTVITLWASDDALLRSEIRETPAPRARGVRGGRLRRERRAVRDRGRISPGCGLTLPARLDA